MSRQVTFWTRQVSVWTRQVSFHKTSDFLERTRTCFGY